MKNIYICRHGETEWNISNKHTSFTDIHLTKNGEKQALALKERLKGGKFSNVFTSPLKRSIKTCEIAGFQGKIDNDLVEWNYGEFEGLTTEQIKTNISDWSVFKYGCKGGESIDDATKRGNEIVKKMLLLEGDVLLFTHGHFSRVIIACWLKLSAREGRFFISSNASLSILGYEHNEPVLKLLNESSYIKKS